MWVPMFTLVAHTYMLDFVDVELQNRIVGVSPYRPQARSRTAVLVLLVSSGLCPLWLRGALLIQHGETPS